MPEKIVLEIGKKYARLTVLKECGRSNDGKVLWECKCDCGNTTVTTGRAIFHGRTKSCGCFMRETTARLHKTHGMSNSSEHKTWMSMIKRCENKNDKCYRHYGGRGIRVHESWRHSFPNFLRDVGLKPTPKHEIERVNNNGGYEPGNVVWATHQEQVRNTRRNRLVTINGVTKPIVVWANDFKIKITSVYTRLAKGWSVIDALKKPLLHAGHEKSRGKRNGHLIKVGGVMMPIGWWSKHSGVPFCTITGRLKRGWHPDRAALVPTKKMFKVLQSFPQTEGGSNG
jgi:hypothetical protein